MRCPRCGNDLRRSKKDPNYGLCDNCRKKYKWINEQNKCKSSKPFISNTVKFAKPSGKKKKKGCLFTFVFIAIFLLIMFLLPIFSDDSEDINSVTPPPADDVTTNEDPQPNTTAAVDAIARNAKESANKSSSDEKREEAVQYIYEHYPNYFDSNEVMEKAMYYGYYLEYAYAKNGSDNLYANLGIDTYQVVKYYYRGSEDLTSEFTTENLKQIKESLEKLGYELD